MGPNYEFMEVIKDRIGEQHPCNKLMERTRRYGGGTTKKAKNPTEYARAGFFKHQLCRRDQTQLPQYEKYSDQLRINIQLRKG